MNGLLRSTGPDGAPAIGSLDQSRLLISLVTVLLLWLLRSLILRAVLRQITEPRTRHTWQKLTAIVYASVKESGVLLTMRYLCDPKQRRGSEHAIWEQILKEFQGRQDIEFAYPTWRVYALNGETPPSAP